MSIVSKLIGIFQIQRTYNSSQKCRKIFSLTELTCHIKNYDINHVKMIMYPGVKTIFFKLFCSDSYICNENRYEDYFTVKVQYRTYNRKIFV